MVVVVYFFAIVAITYCCSTKEIRFSLPTLRQASSLGDLLPGDNDAESDRDTDSLVPASAAHTQRSNSFSKFPQGYQPIKVVSLETFWCFYLSLCSAKDCRNVLRH